MIPACIADTKDEHNLLTIMDDFKYPITRQLRDNVEWNKVFSTILSYQDVYNDRSMRFVKSELVSRALQRFSNNWMQFVDQIGNDFIVPSSGVRIEMKSGKKIFQWNSYNTVDIKLKNSNGSSSYGQTISKSFDYLLLVEPGAVGVVSWENLESEIRNVGDGFAAKIDLNDVEIVKRLHNTTNLNVNLRDRLNEMFEYALNDIDALGLV